MFLFQVKGVPRSNCYIICYIFDKQFVHHLIFLACNSRLNGAIRSVSTVLMSLYLHTESFWSPLRYRTVLLALTQKICKSFGLGFRFSVYVLPFRFWGMDLHVRRRTVILFVFEVLFASRSAGTGRHADM